jgi:hypothetical protein
MLGLTSAAGIAALIPSSGVLPPRSTARRSLPRGRAVGMRVLEPGARHLLITLWAWTMCPSRRDQRCGRCRSHDVVMGCCAKR